MLLFLLDGASLKMIERLAVDEWWWQLLGRRVMRKPTCCWTMPAFCSLPSFSVSDVKRRLYHTVRRYEAPTRMERVKSSVATEGRRRGGGRSKIASSCSARSSCVSKFANGTHLLARSGVQRNHNDIAEDESNEAPPNPPHQ